MTAHLAAIAIGLLLGGLSGLLHLRLCAARASMIVKGRSGLGLLLYPVGLVPPALAVVAAARIADLAAWSVLAGILLVRILVLRKGKEQSP